LCPADRRIQDFLDDYLGDVNLSAKLPSRSFVLDRYGLARTLSLPPPQSKYTSWVFVVSRIIRLLWSDM